MIVPVFHFTLITGLPWYFKCIHKKAKGKSNFVPMISFEYLNQQRK